MFRNLHYVHISGFVRTVSLRRIDVKNHTYSRCIVCWVPWYHKDFSVRKSSDNAIKCQCDNRRVWSVFFTRHKKDYETKLPERESGSGLCWREEITLPENQVEYTGESRRGVWDFLYLTTSRHQRRLKCIQRLVEWSWIVNWNQKCEDVSLLQHHVMTMYAREQAGSRGNNSDFFHIYGSVHRESNLTAVQQVQFITFL